MIAQYRLLTLYPNHVLNYGIGHAALSIVEAMRYKNLDVKLISTSNEKSVQSIYLKNSLPSLFSKIAYKVFSLSSIQKLTEYYFITQLKPNDIVYLWPGASIGLFRKIKAKGNLIVMESINCHQKISKEILDNESQRLGIVATTSITLYSIIDEIEMLQLCDFVFSPSLLVTQSLIDTGVPQEKVLDSSYGLHKYQQLNKPDKNIIIDKPVTAIFVGRIGMRKGIHLLLDYWVSAKINGTLKIIGNIEESIRDLIAPYQDVSNIEFVSFIPDIETAYKEADIFVLPSLEEGSPLVTYLALGAGLPCIVSPMAGEGVITHGAEGFVIEPHDKNGWVNALQQLFKSALLRQMQAKAARKKSDTFLWENVGRQRADLLLKKLQRN